MSIAKEINESTLYTAEEKRNRLVCKLLQIEKKLEKFPEPENNNKLYIYLITCHQVKPKQLIVFPFFIPPLKISVENLDKICYYLIEHYSIHTENVSLFYFYISFIGAYFHTASIRKASTRRRLLEEIHLIQYFL